MRIYNPNLGRFLSVDPISKEYPELAPYQFASNCPIEAIDLDGLEKMSVTDHLEKYTPLLAPYTYAWDFATSGIKKMMHGILSEADNIRDHTQESGYTETVPQETQNLNADMRTMANNVEALEGVVETYEKVSMAQGVAGAGLMFAGGGGGWGSLKIKPTQALNKQQTSSNNGVNITGNKVGAISLKQSTPQTGPEFVSYNTTISGGKINIKGRAVTNGKFDYVMKDDGSLKLGTGHYNLSGGAKTVKGAGQLELWSGRVKSITNNSGHYKPTAAEAAKSVESLKSAGVDMSKAKIKTYDLNNAIKK